MPLSDSRLSAARRAVFVVFFLAGQSFMAFASRLPDVKRVLDVTPGQMGIVLLGVSAGSLVGLPTAGRLAQRFGISRVVGLGLVSSLVGLTLAGVGVSVVEDRWFTMGGLVVAGLGVGVWDVAMNLEGATVERLQGRPLMPRFHAAFSAGTVVGALVGALMSRLHVSVLAHLLVSGVLVTFAGFSTVRQFLPRSPEVLARNDPACPAPARAVRSAWTERRTLMIGVVTMIAACTEGTANDWLGVAMVDGRGLAPWLGTLCFATFLGSMTIGRVVGTGLLERHGRVVVLRWLFALALVGALIVVFAPWPLAFVGAALWGLGASLGFPVGISASADDPDRAAARMSVVSTIGYTAFLAGPPLIGFLGDHFGVLRSLLFVGVLAAVAVVLAPVTAPDPARSGARTASSG